MYTRSGFFIPRFIVREHLTSPTTDSVATFFVSSTDNTTNSTNLSQQLGSVTVGEQFLVTIAATTGNSWVDFTTTATTNSFKMAEGDTLDVRVKKAVSVVSDSTTAKLQGIIWEM
jgi:hypothetical protein